MSELSAADPGARKAIAMIGERMREVWAEVEAEMSAHSHPDRRTVVGMGSTGVALLIGGSTDVVVTWPEVFDTDVYSVEILPTGLIGRAAWSVLSQTTADVTVRVTASLALALGAQFLVVGRS